MWLNTVTYSRGVGEQHFELTQSGTDLKGVLRGEIYNAELTGTCHGDEVKLVADMEVSGFSVTWHFAGTVSGGGDAGQGGTGRIWTGAVEGREGLMLLSWVGSGRFPLIHLR